MSQTAAGDRYFQTERVWKILLRIAPPVMLAQLIQALYNIVDSYFVGQYSNSGLTALSVIFPVQLIITAIAVGTGVGVNTYMARMYAFGKTRAADSTAGTGTVLAVVSWAVFAVAMLLLMEPYVRTSATSLDAVSDAVLYGNIVCVGSIGIFLESIWTKVLQAGGNMRLPMLAQIAGALTNIVLDPILIFGLGPVPRMGIAGAAAATVAGQCVAAVLTGAAAFRRPPKARVMWKYVRQIYRLGYPSIFMQMLYTVYIMALNMILAGFSDDAVTVLAIGVPAFRVIGLSFIPAVLSPMPPVFFQAIGAAGPSLLLSVVRQICCLIPLFWLFSKISLGATWFAYPLSEVITGSLGVAFYLRQLQRWKREAPVAGPTVR